jgi:salicylate hydroxylase
VGAGLGGLATAVALARRGHTVEILEQASALGEVDLPAYAISHGH